MRKAAIGIVAVAAMIGTPVLAADMPLKAPPPPPAPVFSWTGWYVGGNVGYSWGKADTDFNAAPVMVTTSAPASITIPGFAGSQSVKPEGIIGGGQFGYNWQFSPNWVVGLETDIQGSGEKASNNFSAIVDAVTGAAVTNYEAKILWFGTVRGRIGYASDRVMLYATGGLAYGEVKIDGTTTISGSIRQPGLLLPFSITHAIGHSQVNAGWTVGAGVEAVLVGNWTW